jgi:hypothetical protein
MSPDNTTPPAVPALELIEPGAAYGPGHTTTSHNETCRCEECASARALGTIRVAIVEVEIPRQMLDFLAEHADMDEATAINWLKQMAPNWYRGMHLVAYPTGPRLRDSNIGGLPVYAGPDIKMIHP